MDTSSSNSKHDIHVAILSSPGMGHLIPVLVLANRLATHHHVKATVLNITAAANSPPPRRPDLLLNFSCGEKMVDVVEIPPVDISHLITPQTEMVAQLFMIVRAALPGVKSAMASMNRRPDALIVDLFCTGAFPIAQEFDIPKYVYVPTNAWFTALTVYCPVLDKAIKGEYVDQTESLRIPGCKPVTPEDVVEPMLDRSCQSYREYLRQGAEFMVSDGILVNTWEQVEPSTLEALRDKLKLAVYPIGPLRRPVEQTSSKNYVIEWLDKQPSESVTYVSFGSGGTLSAQQMTELAHGLELSQQRFIWVVRPPADGEAGKSYLKGGDHDVDDTFDYLPQGFITRLKNVGLVVSEWVEQVKILNHPSVGGFLTHCGWNSTVESITSCVPLIAWPLYAEQRLNATLLVEELGVAVRPKAIPTKVLVSRSEIEKLVRTVMQERVGKEMRDKMLKLKVGAERALSEGGSSYNSMCRVLNDVEIRSKATVGNTV